MVEKFIRENSYIDPTKFNSPNLDYQTDRIVKLELEIVISTHHLISQGT